MVDEAMAARIRELSLSGMTIRKIAPFLQVNRALVADVVRTIERPVPEKRKRNREHRSSGNSSGVNLYRERQLTWIDRARASQWHLIDLKRAGFKARHGEMRIGSDDIRVIPRADYVSGVGSPSAMCAEMA